MTTRTWSNALEEGGCVLALHESDVWLLTVHAKSARGDLEQIERWIANGQDPRDIEGAETITVPVSAIDRIVVPEGTKSVELYYRNSDTNDLASLWFMAEQQNECEEIAHAIATSVKRPYTESRVNETLFNVLTVPVISTLLAAVLAVVLYSTAQRVAAGGGVAVQGGKQGLKQLVVWVATLLGVQGSLAVGILLVAVCLAWLVKNLVVRPQIWTLQFAAGDSRH